MVSVLPSARVVYRSRLPVPEVMARLRERVRPPQGPMLAIQAYFAQDPRPFTGKLFESTFQISRQIRYRNSFLPVCKGTVVRDGDGTRVDVQLVMHEFVVVFMALWLTMASFGGLVGLSLAWNGERPGLFLLLFPLFGLALPRVGFAMEEQKTRAALADVLDATESKA